MPLQTHRLPATTAPPSAAPLALPRLVMQRAGMVALVVLLLALALGLARMHTDIDDEFDAAASLAHLVAGLGSLAQAGDSQALAGLASLRGASTRHPPRHLLLQVQAADGSLLLAPPAAAPDTAVLRWLLAWHRQWLPGPQAQQRVWPLARPDGSHWTVTLLASHESERREALLNLLGTLGLLLACITGLLLVMRWNVQHALAPLDHLLGAISGIQGRDTRAVQALPLMPSGEMEAIAGALRQLGQALDQAEARRRLLSQQVLTLQEDERSRLARELHDEFGQRLTALRVDTAWLARRLVGQPDAAQVLAGMDAQCQHIQQDIRSLLSRLQPFGPDAAGPAASWPISAGPVALWPVTDRPLQDGPPADPPADAGSAAAAGARTTGLHQSQSQSQSLARLAALLQALVAGWGQTGDAAATRYRIRLLAQNAAGQPQPWPDAALADGLRLPQALALALYRISQEALTNVARHARARQALLQLVLQGPLQPGAALRIHWSVQDDGCGLGLPAAAQQRGNGISGLRERVWAQGGALQFGAGLIADQDAGQDAGQDGGQDGALDAESGAGPEAAPDPAGLGLAAQFEACWLAAACQHATAP